MRFAEKFGNVWYTAAILLCCAGTIAAPAQPVSSNRRQPATRKAKSTQVAVAAALPEPVRLRVSYEDGLLSISAQNAPLRDILDQLSRFTGAAIDVPQDADERIAVQLGPAPALPVVVALLDATQFNYLIAGAPNDPGEVRMIQLTRKLASFAMPPAVSVAETEEQQQVPTQADVKANLTGGDEGASDDVEVGTPNAPPPLPAAAPKMATPTSTAPAAAMPPE